eukprot:9035422-Alexandrium_andersonii.AAC.1
MARMHANVVAEPVVVAHGSGKSPDMARASPMPERSASRLSTRETRRAGGTGASSWRTMWPASTS